METTGDESSGQWTTITSFGELVEISFHGFKDEMKLFGGWRDVCVVQGDDCWVEWYLAQRLSLAHSSRVDGVTYS